VRLCLACPNLAATHAALQSEGIRVSWIVHSDATGDYFDLYDLEGTRLTAVAFPAPDGADPDARFAGYAPPRIGVSDVNQAVGWYSEHLGMHVVEDAYEENRVLMGLGDFLPVWLESRSPESFSGRHLPFARPYLLSLDLDEARAWAASQGLDPSPISSSELRVFHFWDPDGNAISVWCYPGARA
jgi:catechol 2,3-dioxygenase-like lactoylglutathione lyase family enzyme